MRAASRVIRWFSSWFSRRRAVEGSPCAVFHTVSAEVTDQGRTARASQHRKGAGSRSNSPMALPRRRLPPAWNAGWQVSCGMPRGTQVGLCHAACSCRRRTGNGSARSRASSCASRSAGPMRQASSAALSAARSIPDPMNTSSCRRSPNGSAHCAARSSRADCAVGQRNCGMAAHQMPSGLTVESAPASENSATQSGHVASQKCPLARITPGSGPFSTACTAAGSKDRRAR